MFWKGVAQNDCATSKRSATRKTICDASCSFIALIMITEKCFDYGAGTGQWSKQMHVNTATFSLLSKSVHAHLALLLVFCAPSLCRHWTSNKKLYPHETLALETLALEWGLSEGNATLSCAWSSDVSQCSPIFEPHTTPFISHKLLQVVKSVVVIRQTQENT